MNTIKSENACQTLIVHGFLFKKPCNYLLVLQIKINKNEENNRKKFSHLTNNNSNTKPELSHSFTKLRENYFRNSSMLEVES